MNRQLITKNTHENWILSAGEPVNIHQRPVVPLMLKRITPDKADAEATWIIGFSENHLKNTGLPKALVDKMISWSSLHYDEIVHIAKGKPNWTEDIVADQNQNAYSIGSVSIANVEHEQNHLIVSVFDQETKESHSYDVAKTAIIPTILFSEISEVLDAVIPSYLCAEGWETIKNLRM